MSLEGMCVGQQLPLPVFTSVPDQPSVVAAERAEDRPTGIEAKFTEDGEDPHGKLRNLDVSAATRAQFLLEGTIETHCDGACNPE